jgi:Spy/CpxP family protein refolding chaperone
MVVQVVAIPVVADEQKHFIKLQTMVPCLKWPATVAGRGPYGESRFTERTEMNARLFCVLAIVCALLTVAASGAAGDETAKKGRNYGSIIDLHYIYFINTHVQELSLTPEQEAKLKALQVEMEKQIDAMVDDPEYQSLQKKMQEANKAKNTDEAKNVLQQIKDFRAQKAPTATQASKFILAILTKEQNSKLGELLRAQREKSPDHPDATTKPAATAPSSPPPDNK